MKRQFDSQKSGDTVDYENLKRVKHSLKAECHLLPIHAQRHHLIESFEKLETAIVIGETGSGKTTQIPQFVFEERFNKTGCIACTQPRRVAAITVAQRVAAEAGSELGKLVGYNVRFDDMTSQESRIIFLTDGMLLREALLDPLLKRYTVVILDEAHERTVHTDVLFSVVKSAQKRRKEQGKHLLKIIIMSATMDVDHFSDYFNKAPVFYVVGRQHDIEMMYSKTSVPDYIFTSLVTLFQIHRETPPNQDILVFLTGQEEIEAAVKAAKEATKHLPSGSIPLIVLPMYSSLPQEQQLNVFKSAPEGARKVIFATNVAETSVTIKGIKFVIDTGMVKAKTFNASSGLDILAIQKVSQAQAWQRAGRAGREAAGVCYRLYKETEFLELSESTIPEIQRCSLSSVVLQLLAMGIENIVDFDFMDKPSPEALQNGLELLHWLGAIDSTTKPKLTPVGRKMAAFPLDPRLSKVILASKDHHCLEEILTIVSLLSADSVLFTPSARRDEAHARRNKFLASEGDHLTLLNIYRAYKAAKGNIDWCRENFINSKNMKLVVEIRKQLRSICTANQLPFESCGRDLLPIRKCLCAGFFMNTAQLQREGHYVTINGKKQVNIHPSSALFQYKPSCVIYNELVQTSKCYIRDLCVVDQEWLTDLAPADFKSIHLKPVVQHEIPLTVSQLLNHHEKRKR